MPTSNPHMVIFGFPVYFRTSFVIAAAFATFLWREFGVLIAVTLAVSILVHELGHSIAFRRYGTESHIVIHLFGGYSSPDSPQRLSHREWVIVSLAGPGAAFVLLGAPAWLLLNFGPWLHSYPFTIATVLVYFNIFWGAANLLPLWPLDGGKVLYHATKGDWEATRIATLGMSAIALLVAFKFGFPLAGMFIVYNAYQVFTSSGPHSAGHSRISDAIKTAKTFEATSTKTRGKAGLAALDLVYQELLRDRPDRAEAPLNALLDNRQHREKARTASAWSQLLAGETVTSESTSSLLVAVEANDVRAAASELQSPEIPIEAACALRVLRQRGHLEDVCAVLVDEPDGPSMLYQLERLTLKHGLVTEQHCVSAALERCAPI